MPAGHANATNWRQDLHLSLEDLAFLRSPIKASDEGKIEAVEFWTSEAGREFVNKRRSVSFRVNDDGSFISIDRVPASDYRFIAFFKSASITKQLTITAGDEQLGHMDLGILQLK
jgi:hypothetical protein